jgi:O-antigen/teichoic acid export membrane protein
MSTFDRWRGEAKAVGWLFGGDALGRLISQVGVVVTARVLGPSAFGSVAVGLAVFGIAAVLADAGIGEAGVQELTRRGDGEERFRREVAPLRLWLALPFMPVGLALVLASDNPPVYGSGVLIAAVPLSAIISGRFLAARVGERFPEVARWTAVIAVGVWAGAVAGVLVDPSVGAAGIGIVLVLGLGATAAARGRPLRRPDGPTAREWLRRGRPFFVIAAAVALYSRGDRVVVAVVEGSAAAGGYAAAYNVVMVVAIAGASIHAAVLPRLIHESRTADPALWRPRVRKLASISVPLAVALALSAPWVIDALYGETYESAGSVLRVLSPLVVLYLLNPFLTATLVAQDRQRVVAKIALSNLAVAVVGYPVLTSVWGVRGTALASVSVETVGLLLALVVMSRSTGGSTGDRSVTA